MTPIDLPTQHTQQAIAQAPVSSQFSSMLWLEGDVYSGLQDSALVFYICYWQQQPKCCSWGELILAWGTEVWVMWAPQDTFPISMSGILSQINEIKKPETFSLSVFHLLSKFGKLHVNSQRTFFVIWACDCNIQSMLQGMFQCFLHNVSSILICRWILPTSLWGEESPVLV